jgi:hypothetical protein
MFALDALLESYPDAKFLWSHRDPAKVLPSVCSLIHYVRSWASDRDDSLELGAEQLGRWSEAIERAMDFRGRVGEDRFADLSFADLQSDPVGALAAAYERIGVGFPERSREAVTRWAGRHEPGAHGRHAYELAQFGLDADQVHERFARYMDTYDAAS